MPTMIGMKRTEESRKSPFLPVIFIPMENQTLTAKECFRERQIRSCTRVYSD